MKMALAAGLLLSAGSLAAAQTLPACSPIGLNALLVPGLTVTDAHPAGAAAGRPDYCAVHGSLAVGEDARVFQMRLPGLWKQRVLRVCGHAAAPAPRQGYAELSGCGAPGDAAGHAMLAAAKALARSYYAAPVRFSYLIAARAAQVAGLRRHPTDYDGVVVGEGAATVAADPGGLSTFFAQGRKMLVYSLETTGSAAAETFYRAAAPPQLRAGDSVRLYRVPVDAPPFDALAPLVIWVEQGQAPEAIFVGGGTGAPLCAYPMQARNLRCVQPTPPGRTARPLRLVRHRPARSRRPRTASLRAP